MDKEKLFNHIEKINFARLATSPIRVLPDFLIIGAQKSGTTSLFNSLVNHSCVVKPIWKEIHFFDNFYNRGINWYKSCFHTSIFKYYQRIQSQKKVITGEATPYYLYHPLCAQRISKILPNVKLIVLLRNPIDRAYSHYAMSVRQGWENLSFEDAIKFEQKRLEGEKEKIIQNENYFSFKDLAYSYLCRGIYVNQLKTWMGLFPRNQFLVIKSEEYESFPEKILNDVLNFLHLPKEIVIHEKQNVGTYEKMNESTRKILSDFFKPYNEELYKFLDVDYHW
jgi:hypothetical protein